jgi:hypothetical protein
MLSATFTFLMNRFVLTIIFCHIVSTVFTQDFDTALILKNKVKKVKVITDSALSEEYNFNSEGNLIKHIIYYDFSKNGYRVENTYEYGNRLLTFEIQRRFLNEQLNSTDTTFYQYDSKKRLEFKHYKPKDPSEFETLDRFVYYEDQFYKSQLWKVLHYKNPPLKFDNQIPCEFYFNKIFYLESFEVYRTGASTKKPNGVKYYTLYSKDEKEGKQLFVNSSVQDIYWLNDSLKQTVKIKTSFDEDILTNNLTSCDTIEYYSSSPSIEEIIQEKFKDSVVIEKTVKEFLSRYKTEFSVKYFYLPNGLLKEQINEGIINNAVVKRKWIFEYL